MVYFSIAYTINAMQSMPRVLRCLHNYKKYINKSGVGNVVLM